MQTPRLRIGTRGSRLALAQAEETRQRLSAAHGFDPREIEIVAITTTGDRIRDRPLNEIGGKGLFTKEIEEALLSGAVDMAVHSMKDMPAELPRHLVIAALLPREDARDALISPHCTAIRDLKPACIVGSASVRRAAQLKRLRPDIQVVNLRGNVETRLAKLARGEADGIILARAGLSRLGIRPDGAEILTDWLPALCQGAIGIEIRESNLEAAKLIAPIDHRDTHVTIACERGFLATLDGSCRTPIAGHARLDGQKLAFRGEVLTTDGRNVWMVSRAIALSAKDVREAADAAGRDAAREILEHAGDKLPRF